MRDLFELPHKLSKNYLFAVYLYSTSWVLVVVGGIFFKKERKKKKIKGNKRENNQTEKSFFCFISLIAVAPKSSSLHRKIPPGCLHAPPLLTDQITSLLYLFFFFYFFLFLSIPPLLTDQIMMMMEMRKMVDPILMLLPCFLIKSLLFLHDDDNG